MTRWPVSGSIQLRGTGCSLATATVERVSRARPEMNRCRRKEKVMVDLPEGSNKPRGWREADDIHVQREAQSVSNTTPWPLQRYSESLVRRYDQSHAHRFPDRCAGAAALPRRSAHPGSTHAAVNNLDRSSSFTAGLHAHGARHRRGSSDPDRVVRGIAAAGC